MASKQIWRATSSTGLQFKFYESHRQLTTEAMWSALKSMVDETSRVPLIVDVVDPSWEATTIFGRRYHMVPIDEISLISPLDTNDSDQIFLSDVIKGTAGEA